MNFSSGGTFTFGIQKSVKENWNTTWTASRKISSSEEVDSDPVVGLTRLKKDLKNIYKHL